MTDDLISREAAIAALTNLPVFNVNASDVVLAKAASVIHKGTEAIRALPSVEPTGAVQVQVKPLVWEGHSDQERSGNYMISPSYGQGPEPWLLARGSNLIGWYAEKWLAKVAAQGNHEVLVYAALDMQPTVKPDVAALVEVKPLEWLEGDEPDEWQSWPYDVWCELGKFQLYHWSIVMGAPHETAEAAKAAAQADYEARIRSALVVTPTYDPAKVQAMVEALEWYADKDNYDHVYERMPCDCCTDIFKPVERDEGDKARAALAAFKVGEVG